MSDAWSRRLLLSRTLWMMGAAAWMSGCSSPKKVSVAPVPPAPPTILSAARNTREYRRDMAQHLYQLNRTRIYRGKLPPLLYAIGVTRLTVSPQGELLEIDWMRQPRHAPEVVAEIERTIRAAAPFPVAPALARLDYTETWLWDKSGRFQLDTLTEGQS